MGEPLVVKCHGHELSVVLSGDYYIRMHTVLGISQVNGS